MHLIKGFVKLQVFKFLLAGLFCASIEYVLFVFFVNVLYINYLIANPIAIIIAIGINYFLSIVYIFGKSSYSKTNEVLAFIIFSALAIGLNQSVLWFFVEIIKLDIRICKALAIIIVASFNFFTKKYIVFRK
jgi:putative flippase GtrA